MEETMRTLRPEKQRRRPKIALFLITLCAAALLSYAALTGTLAAPEQLAGARAQLLAAAASAPSFFDWAAGAIYRTFCPYVSDCDVEYAALSSQQQPAPTAAKPQPLPAQNSPDGSARSQASSTQPIVYQTVNQPVIERVIERQRVVTEGGITEATLGDRLNLLENKLRSLIFSQSSQQSAQTSAVYNAVALSQRIDNLSGTNISNPTITGGSITGSSIIGTISNAIATALATIDDLTSVTITATNATFTNSTTTNATTTNLYAASLTAGNATTTSLAVLGAATSSFGGGVSAARVSASATSTFSGLVLESGQLRLSPLDCSSYANGGTLTTDASGNVVCAADDGGAGSTVAGADTQIQFNNGGSFGAAANFTFSSSTGKLTLPNASTTNLTASYASSTQGFFGSLSLGSLSGVLKATGGLVSAASPGSDYESPLTFGYPLTRSLNAISLAFGTTTTNTWTHQIFSSLFASGASTTNATTTNLHITGLSNSGLGVDANGKVYAAATSTLSNISGTLALTQLANQNANTVLVNNTAGAAAPTAIATSSLFGSGIGGTVLAWNNGVPQWVATTTLSNGTGITTTYSAATNQWNITNTGATFAFPFTTLDTFGTTSAATSSSIHTAGVFFASSTAASSVFPFASSTAITISGTASTSFFFANGLTNCSSNNNLTWVNGTFGCEPDDTATGEAPAFAWESNYAAVNAATSSVLWAKFGMNASSTSHFANASTSQFTTGTQWFASLANSGLGVDANGKVYAAATSTLATISGILPIGSGGTGTSTSPTYGKVLVGNTAGGYDLLATSSLGITGGEAATWGTISGTLSSQTDLQNALDAKLSLSSWYATTTDGLAQGTINKYYSTLLFAADLAGTTTDALAQGSVNKYYANSLVQAFVHSSTTIPKTYTANTFAALQTITNASTTNLTASYASSTQGFFGSLAIGNFSGFLKATAGAVASALINLASDVTGTLGVGNGGTGWANIAASAIPFGNGSGALATTTAGTNGSVLAYLNGIPTWTATTTFSAPLTYSGGAVSIAAANGSTDGFLTSGDWTTFNSKQAALTFSYPLQNITNTVSLAFATTTANTWGAHNIFFSLFSTNASTTNATTTNLYLTGLTSSGLGVDANGKVYAAATSTLSTISGALPLSSIAQIGANSVLVNNTSALGNVTSIGTSTFFGTGTGGQVLSWNSGVPQWVATTTLTNGSGITTTYNAASNQWNITNTGATFAFPFTTSTTFGTTSAATSSSIQTAGVFFASSTAAASVFPFASTTALSAGTLCLSTDCRTAWPAGGGSGDPFTHETWWGQSGVSATTSALHLTGSPFSLFASSTAIFELASSTAASTTQLTTGTQWFTGLTSSGLGVDANGKVYAAATSTLANISGTLALTQLANQNANTVLANATAGSAAPTAIATSSFFGTGAGGQVLAWNSGVPQWVATTTLTNGTGITTAYNAASNQWTIANTGATFAFPFTTSTTYGTTSAATSSSIQTAGVFFASSTAASSVFPFASSTALSATALCLSADCRTTWPTGGGSGDPFPVHTSYAGLTTSGTSSTLWLTGATVSLAASSSVLTFASSTAFTASGSGYFATDAGASVGIGTTSAWGLLSINPNGIAGPAFVIGSSSATNFIVTNAGKVGIGTTSPGYALDVNGDVNVASGKCFRVDGVCIGYVTKLAGIYATSSVGTTTVAFGNGGPSFSGSTVTLPASTTQIVVEVWGGGGGGGGNSATNGGSGQSSCFGTNSYACVSSLLYATGGTGGSVGGGGAGSNGGLGGVGGSGFGGDVNLSGGGGVSGGNLSSSGTSAHSGAGGSAPRGGGGGAAESSTGDNGWNFGGGGAGAGASNTAGSAGGGAGGYSQKLVNSPSGTYYFTVGAGGAAGTGARAGGAGGSGGVVITVYATSSPTAAGNDYAEMFPVSSPGITAGDIVAVDAGMPVSMKLAAAGEGAPLAGIIATNPGQLLGDKEAVGSRPVALSGRVPAKVNLEGGPIQIGDRIAPSSVPGIGKKAGPFDESVGIALEAFSGADGSSQGSVTVFLDLQRGIDINAIAFALLGPGNPIFAVSTSSAASSTSPLDFVGGMMNAFASRIMAIASASGTSADATTTAEIATTATSTPSDNDTYASGFLHSLFAQLTKWFADAANGITNLFADTFHARKQICIKKSDGADACVTGDQLAAVLSATNQTPEGNLPLPTPASAAPPPTDTATSTDSTSSPQAVATSSPPTSESSTSPESTEVATSSPAVTESAASPTEPTTPIADSPPLAPEEEPEPTPTATTAPDPTEPSPTDQ